MRRTILHADMNNCYASIEQARDPSLRGRPMAVCGSVEERHGIVLAKSQEAKRFGIKTGETIHEAQTKCPDLLIVPPHFDLYLKASKEAHRIYLEYTDRVEPYGMDECWLDVTGSRRLFGSGEAIAETLRARFRREMGITISVGISDNRIFAKLGSDYKKPDAQTRLDRDNMTDRIWPLPVGDLLFVGRRTNAKLLAFGIRTIGDLANAKLSLLEHRLGINGRKLWIYANGLDDSPIMPYTYRPPIKSIGNGTTFRRDLVSLEEVSRCARILAQKVSSRLIKAGFLALCATLYVKDSDFVYRRFHAQLVYPSSNVSDICEPLLRLFAAGWDSSRPVRALTVRAETLVPGSLDVQTGFFSDFRLHEKRESVGRAMTALRDRFGEKAAVYAAVSNFELADLESPRAEMPFTMF